MSDVPWAMFKGKINHIKILLILLLHFGVADMIMDITYTRYVCAASLEKRYQDSLFYLFYPERSENIEVHA